MDKPISILCKETEEKLVKVINESGLPPFLLLQSIQNIQLQLVDLVNKEEENYQREQNMKKVKDGDK